jgi:vacuolar-type H+-ATPase subunit I/STV1
MSDDDVDMDFDVDKIMEEKRILEEKLQAKEKELNELGSLSKEEFALLKQDFSKLKDTFSGFNSSEILKKVATLQSNVDNEVKNISAQQNKLAELESASAKWQAGNESS